MRIAIFWAHIQHYHAARIAGLIAEARRGGDEVVAFALGSGSRGLPAPGYEGLLGDRIAVLSPGPCEADVYASAVAARRIVRKLDEAAPDAVAIPGYDHRAARTALGWCRRARRGAVLMSESQASDYPRSRAREFAKRRIVSLYDAALVGGTRHVEYARQLGLPPECIFTGYDVVDNAFWGREADAVRADPAQWRARLGVPERFVLAACRFVPKKNVLGLIREYAAAARRMGANAWPMVLVGAGPDEGAIVQAIREAGLERSIRLPGYLRAEELVRYYALASVFVLASARSEQWGLVVNEAMACGTPAFVSRVCGCVPDLVEEGVTGYSFDPARDGELADLLTRAGSMDLAGMGAAARRRVAALSPERFGRNLVQAARMAAERASSRPRIPFPPPTWWR